MLGLLTTAPPPHQQAAAAHGGLGSDPELLSKALQGRLTLSPQLSDCQAAAMQRLDKHPPPGSPDLGAAPLPRRSSSCGSNSGSGAGGCGDSSGDGSPLHQMTEKEAASLAAALAVADKDALEATDGQAKDQDHRHQLEAATPDNEISGDQPQEPSPLLHPGGARSPSPAPGEPPAPQPPAGATAAPAAQPAASLSPAPSPAPQDQVALLQAQLCACNERAATLEFHLRAKAGELAQLDAFRRRVQELEALYALSSSELARANDQHQATQQAVIAQLKAQQLRIMLLEEHLRMAAAGSEELHAALLQQQLAAQAAAAAAQGPLARAGSAAAALGGHPAPPQSAFEAASSMGLTGGGVAASMPLQLGAPGLGLMERQSSLPNPHTAALSDFARDQEVWAVRHSPVGVSAAARPQRAQSLALPGGGGGAVDGWGGMAQASSGFAAAASAAPLSLSPLPSAGSASAWDAGVLLMAGRQQSLLDQAAAAAAAAHHHSDVISERHDAQRLAGLLPFDLDTLGSERSDSSLTGGAAQGGGGAPPLPPLSRSQSSGGGARSAALKAAAAQKQAAAAAAAHLQLLAEHSGDLNLRRWSEQWGLDADVCAAADHHLANPLAAALKRFGPSPPAALSAAAAASRAAGPLPGDAAALYGAAAAAAAAHAHAQAAAHAHLQRGRASSAAGEDRDAELDAAAQNSRLRSKRDATPNTCVYVGFLGWWVTEKELEACFAPHGKLVSVRLLISKKSRRSREQAFVEFDSVASAQAAIAAMDGIDTPTLVKQPACGGLVVRFADRKKEEEM